jgi:hypothetical protein
VQLIKHSEQLRFNVLVFDVEHTLPTAARDLHAVFRTVGVTRGKISLCIYLQID